MNDVLYGYLCGIITGVSCALLLPMGKPKKQRKPLMKKINRLDLKRLILRNLANAPANTRPKADVIIYFSRTSGWHVEDVEDLLTEMSEKDGTVVLTGQYVQLVGVGTVEEGGNQPDGNVIPAAPKRTIVINNQKLLKSINFYEVNVHDTGVFYSSKLRIVTNPNELSRLEGITFAADDPTWVIYLTKEEMQDVFKQL